LATNEMAKRTSQLLTLPSLKRLFVVLLLPPEAEGRGRRRSRRNIPGIGFVHFDLKQDLKLK
jgi:hypothetical protein